MTWFFVAISWGLAAVSHVGSILYHSVRNQHTVCTVVVVAWRSA